MTASITRRSALFLRTVRHMRPIQVVHRARLRGQRFVAHRFPGAAGRLLARPVVTAPGWPAGFATVDQQVAEGCPDPATNANGAFRFLANTRDLGSPPDWSQAGADRLWRFHLHYFEWAWSFALHADREWARLAFGRLWRSWLASSPPGRGDAWSPYVSSLRAWVLCGVYEPLVAGSELEREYLATLGVHARFVRSHLELDVGGNHLLKNVKALFGLGVFLGDARLEGAARRLLARELGVQVLADGGHYERSPSYHCQVLGDLLDIRNLLAAAGREQPPRLDQAIASMRGWLGVILLPDGDVPLLNDCVFVGAPRLAVLAPALPPAQPLTVLEPSGYVVVRAGGRVHLVADVGPPCPPDLPAHAHADCLSFELAVDGKRVVVDTGTSTYERGARRDHERSTAAHNTVEVDGADQSEMWGVFRVARRATPVLEAAREDEGAVIVVASHDGYTRLQGQPRHRRTWRIEAGGVTLIDEVLGSGVHTITSRVHLSGDAPSGTGPLAVRADGAPLRVEPAELASGFGCLSPGHVVVAEVTTALPARITFLLGLRPAREAGRCAGG